MKRKVYILTLMSIALAACTNSDVLYTTPEQEGYVPYEPMKHAISFNMHTNNTTRSTVEAQHTEHYEFGVWTALNGAYATDTCKPVMQNYLVAYTGNDAYNPWKEKEALWAYPGMGYNDDKAPQTVTVTPYTKSSHKNQVISYWEEDAGKYYFYAYTPYMHEGTVSQQGTITIGNNADGEYLQFNGLRAFYTSPANNGIPSSNISSYQTGRVVGKQTSAGYHATDSLGSNAEIINANEALYAGQSMIPDLNAPDVPIIFKHVNAKVRVAFWEDIKGYDVELLDLVPADTTVTYAGGQPIVRGVVFTPATKEMTDVTKPQTPKAQLAPYYSNACVRVEGIQPVSIDSRTNFSNIVVGNAAYDDVTHENLYFAVPAADTKLSTKKETATMLPTIYYPLPNYESSIANPGYITAVAGGSKVASNTGFTVHVSFAMKPQDETQELKIYDARVYVPADQCRWEPGKLYTTYSASRQRQTAPPTHTSRIRLILPLHGLTLTTHASPMILVSRQ
ncbi:MAG: hypothetical protein KBT39_09255 [Bacteroidales bacterium]|nr:hypothetical protein [Bacteroidales bacterium]